MGSILRPDYDLWRSKLGITCMPEAKRLKEVAAGINRVWMPPVESMLENELTREV